MKKYIRIILFFVTTCAIYAQEDVTFNQYSEDYFLLGMRQYAQKDFRGALNSFQNSLSAFPQNHRITASSIMIAKTYFALKLYDSAITSANLFVSNFPQSRYHEDAYFTRAMSNYAKEDFQGAMNDLFLVLSVAQQPLNIRHSFRTIDHIAMEYLSRSEIEVFFKKTTNDSLRSVFALCLAERTFALKETDKTTQYLSAINLNVLPEGFIHRYNRLKARNDKSNNVKIAVLLPLQNNAREETREKRIATEVLEGIRFAVSEYEANNPFQRVSILLEVFDTERRPERVEFLIDSLAKQKSVVGIIGPLFSDETMRAASAAQKNGIPLLTPTATDEGITVHKNFVFQGNTTTSIKTKAIAQYAALKLGFKTFAIIGADVPSAKAAADTFAAEIKKYDGTIAADLRYAKEQNDLRSLMKSLRKSAADIGADYVLSFAGKLNPTETARKLISMGAAPRLVDSLIEKKGTASARALFGDNAKQYTDSLKLPYKKITVPVDSLQYMLNTIDAVFAPISNKAEIGVIVSQLTLFNIKTTVLGLSDWYDANELDMNKRYADGTIFCSEKWIDNEKAITQQVTTRFAGRYGKQPTENVLFGFDAMNLFAVLLNDGAVTSKELAASLSLVSNFGGVRNTVTFAKSQTNLYVNILQYKSGKVKKIDGITVKQ